MSDFSSNPMLIDGVMAAPYKQITKASEPVYVHQITWESPEAPGEFRIEDPASGRILMKAESLQSGKTLNFYFGASGLGWDDFKVTELPSGKLLLFVTVPFALSESR